MEDTAAQSGSERRTLLTLLQQATDYLSSRNIDDARLNVELLLSRVLSMSRIQLYTNFDRPISPGELKAFKELFQRRLRKEPLQYILGETEFMGRKFLVDSRVLIPRPETEILVERVMQFIGSEGCPAPEILEVGTGSGNIAVTLAAEFPGSKVTSMDISHDALEVARKNASLYKLSNLSLHEGDVFEEVSPGVTFDVMVSNPPYIPRREWETLAPEVRDFEPRIATTDEADGLRFVQRILSMARDKVRGGGCVFLELGYGQSADAVDIATKAGLSRIEVIDDYQKIPRILTARV